MTRKITPHKGGRTVRLPYMRVTLQERADFMALLDRTRISNGRGTAAADLVMVMVDGAVKGEAICLDCLKTASTCTCNQDTRQRV